MSLAPRTPEKAMADGNRALQEVGALAAERRRFESWIAALEARRDSTPAHVFERVLRDYRERLDRVNEQLGSHQAALEDERASLASRLALLEGEEQMRRDERAELELRAHVGELSDAETGASFASLDEALKQLASERQSLESSLAGLRELLAAGDDQGSEHLINAITTRRAPMIKRSEDLINAIQSRQTPTRVIKSSDPLITTPSRPRAIRSPTSFAKTRRKRRCSTTFWIQQSSRVPRSR